MSTAVNRIMRAVDKLTEDELFELLRRLSNSYPGELYTTVND